MSAPRRPHPAPTSGSLRTEPPPAPPPLPLSRPAGLGAFRTRRWRWLRAAAWLTRLRGSPEQIARGLAVGTVVAFTPTIGVQTLLALGLATLLRANRPVSIVPTWLTNPITIPPVYLFTYWVGSHVWPGPSAEEVGHALRVAAGEIARSDVLALHNQLGTLMALGGDVIVAMAIGGLIVGIGAGAVVYFGALRGLAALQARKRRRRRSRVPPGGSNLRRERSRANARAR